MEARANQNPEYHLLNFPGESDRRAESGRKSVVGDGLVPGTNFMFTSFGPCRSVYCSSAVKIEMSPRRFRFFDFYRRRTITDLHGPDDGEKRKSRPTGRTEFTERSSLRNDCFLFRSFFDDFVRVVTLLAERNDFLRNCGSAYRV